MIFLPKISVPFPKSPLDNLPYTLNIIEQMILIPLTLFFHVIFFPKALKLPSPLHNLKFFPKGFDKLPPPPGVGNEELYTPPVMIVFKLKENKDWTSNTPCNYYLINLLATWTAEGLAITSSLK